MGERKCRICGSEIKYKNAYRYCGLKCRRTGNLQSRLKYRQKNKEKIKIADKLYRQTHKRNRDWERNNPERIKWLRRKSLKIWVENLRDMYVRDKIVAEIRRSVGSGVKYNKITKEIIEIKREQLLLHRQLNKAREVLNGTISR